MLLKEYCLHHSLKMIFSGTMLVQKNIVCIITLVPYTTLIHSVLSFHKNRVLLFFYESFLKFPYLLNTSKQNAFILYNHKSMTFDQNNCNVIYSGDGTSVNRQQILEECL